jgi:hypothetical protein
MSQARVSLVLAGLLALANDASAAEAARLFFTPAQRAALDNARKQNIRVEISNDGEQQTTQAPVAHNISVNGLIRRSDGKNTIWLNNRVVTEQQPGTVGAAISKTENRVLLNVPESGRKLDLKVGQSVEIVSGTIEESYLRRSGAKPEPKAANDGEKTVSEVAKVTSPVARDAVRLEPGLQRRPARADGDSRDEPRTDDGVDRK